NRVPYYRCEACGLTSYSASRYSTAMACPNCSAPLTGASSGSFPPEPEVRLRLTHDMGAAAEARRALRGLSLSAADLHSVALVVSELVTNSVRHSGAEEPIQLVVVRREG